MLVMFRLRMLSDLFVRVILIVCDGFRLVFILGIGFIMIILSSCYCWVRCSFGSVLIYVII